jgi:hypothetical protein
MLLLLMLAVAGGLPYLMSSEFRGGATKKVPALPEATHGALPSTDYGAASATAGPHSAASSPGADSTARLATADGHAGHAAGRAKKPNLDLAQVFSFDVTPAWVMSQWPRVSASLGDVDLQGYRVPLVSGVSTDDVAGSLSYYFDNQQHVVRITFRGATGDPRKLVHMLSTRFGFRREATEDPSLVMYAVKWNNEARSELRIRTATVVRSHEGHANFDLELALRRF